MTRMTRMPGAVRALTLVVTLLTVLAILPPAPVAASVIKVVALDDTQPEFGAGSRTLTAVIPTTLSNDPISGQVTEPYAGAKPGDQGGLAMAAIRALRWITQPANPLPAVRTAIGAAVIGDTIWVVGGSSGGTGYESTVYRGVSIRITDSPAPESSAGRLPYHCHPSATQIHRRSTIRLRRAPTQRSPRCAPVATRGIST